MLRQGFLALHPAGFEHGNVQNVLRTARECDVLQFGIGYLLVGEDSAVDEGLHRVEVRSQPPEGRAGRVVTVPDDAEEKVVRPDAVAACPHRLLAGVVDDAVEFLRYSDFHNCFPPALFAESGSVRKLLAPHCPAAAGPHIGAAVNADANVGKKNEFGGRYFVNCQKILKFVCLWHNENFRFTIWKITGMISRRKSRQGRKASLKR